MQFVVMFIPWIAYAVLSDTTSWTLALGVALALAAVNTVRQLRSTRQIDILDLGGLVFFAGLLLAALAGAPRALHAWAVPGANVWITALMWLSLATGRPFVRAAARRQAPAEAWHSPAFTTMVLTITLLWATTFTVGSLILVATAVWPVPGVALAVNVLQIVIPVLLMRRPIAQARGILTGA